MLFGSLLLQTFEPLFLFFVEDTLLEGIKLLCHIVNSVLKFRDSYRFLLAFIYSRGLVAA